MTEIAFQWMAHHEGAIPPAGQGKRISTYNVALEGWRRGLQLDFYGVIEDKSKLKLRYSLSNGERTHHFQLSMGDKVTKEAFDICDNKELTKQYLRKLNVPVPEGKMFTNKSDKKEIGDYAEKIGFPVVLKPTDGNAGKGVFANIQDRESLLSLVDHVQNELGFKEILVERFIQGNEYRIFVIEDRVLGAMIRRPASVLGDGVHTISQLIDKKNKIRKTNPHLTSRLIKVDREVIDLLNRSDYSLKSIPEKGARIYLRTKSNLSAGGDSIDVTDQLTPELKEIVINAGKAIPGLAHYGVDMIVDEERNTGTILEVNARPGIGGHMFPVEGQPRDFAKEIIDFYFPETKNVVRSPLYFDFDTIIEPIINRQVRRTQVMKTPVGPFYGKELILTGIVQNVGFQTWSRRQALNRGLHGHFENLEDGRIRIRIMGTDKELLEEFKAACYTGPYKAEVKDLEENEWNKPILLGYEVIKAHTNLSKRQIRNLARNIERLEKEKARAVERYQHLLNRRTWRYTEPLRKVAKKILKRS
ncbi:MAG: ATP-grasp domain-containing protein [Bacteroidales bacterium]|nr:ATP-grasp domain-containing protein [Bacteroidales bacterium]